jgi:hypothetical protein
MVWIATDLGDPAIPDLIVTANQDLVAFPDLDPEASTHPCVRCSPVTGPASDPRDVVALTAADTLPGGGAELLVALHDPDEILPNQIARFAASGIAADDGTDCFSTQSPSLLPGGTTDYGTSLVAGDLDDDGMVEIVAAAPATARVEVTPDFGPSGPSGPSFAVTAAVSSPAFGAALAIGDLDADGRAELIVGDPAIEQDDVPAAGTAFVFTVGDDRADERAAIYPARSDPEQQLGHVLTTAPNVGSDPALLVTGTVNRLFVYFRALPDPD